MSIPIALPCGQKDIKTAAGAEIDDHFTGFEMCGSGGITAGKPHIGCGWNRGELVGGISKCFRNRFDPSVIVGE